MTDVVAAPTRPDSPQAPLATEQEAREVCTRLTLRGQVCFAAAQTR